MYFMIFLVLIPYGILARSTDPDPRSTSTLPCSANDVAAGGVAQAWDGYDIWKSDVWGDLGDPGRRNQIFDADCTGGFHDFVTVRRDWSCATSYETKTVTTLMDYLYERSGSDEWGTSFSRESSASATIKGVEIGLEASLAFQRRKESKYQEVKKFFEETKGEISISDARCGVVDVTINAQWSRPLFRTSFVDALKAIDNVLNGQTAAPFNQDQISAMVEFIDHFGTHYGYKTELGARFQVEERFDARSTSQEALEYRSECSKEEFTGCFGGSIGIPMVFSVGTKTCAGRDKATCKAKTNNEKVGESYDERTIKTRYIGAPKGQPGAIDYYAGISSVTEATAVPLGRDLHLMSKLFTESYLAQSDTYRFDKSLNAVGIKNLFEFVAEDYCQRIVCQEGEDCASCNLDSQLLGCGLNDNCTPDQRCIPADNAAGFQCTPAPPVQCQCTNFGSVRKEQNGYTCDDGTDRHCATDEICYKRSFAKSDIQSACRTPEKDDDNMQTCVTLSKWHSDKGENIDIKVDEDTRGVVINHFNDGDRFHGWNDRVSSLVVKPGCFFAGFEDNDATDFMFTLDNVEQKTPLTLVVGDHHDNKMTGLTCQCSKICAVLYEDRDYKGDQLPVPEGDVADVRHIYHDWNDRTSSLKITSGCTFTAFKDENYEKQMFSQRTELPRFSDGNDKITSWKCEC